MLINISSHRVGIEPTTSRFCSHTLGPCATTALINDLVKQNINIVVVIQRHKSAALYATVLGSISILGINYSHFLRFDNKTKAALNSTSRLRYFVSLHHDGLRIFIIIRIIRSD